MQPITIHVIPAISLRPAHFPLDSAPRVLKYRDTPEVKAKMKISPLSNAVNPRPETTDITCKGIGIMGGKKGKRLCGRNTNPISMKWKSVTCPDCLSKKAAYQFEVSLSRAAILEVDSDFPFDEEGQFLAQMNYRD